MKRALWVAALVLVLALVCLLLAACLLRVGRGVYGGGLVATLAGAAGPPRRPRRTPDPAESPHLIVDTLNLAHWVHGEALREGRATLTPDLIAETVDRTAPTLKLRHPGTIVYVLKDRESRFNDEAARAVYKAAADRNRVWIAVAEQYPDPPAGVKKTEEHSARGRDDFYIALLARRWRCAVLTEDRLRDFDRFRATIPPFHVYEFAFWRDLPHREFVRPDSPAYARLRKPRMVRYAEYFPRGPP